MCAIADLHEVSGSCRRLLGRPCPSRRARVARRRQPSRHIARRRSRWRDSSMPLAAGNAVRRAGGVAPACMFAPRCGSRRCAASREVEFAVFGRPCVAHGRSSGDGGYAVPVHIDTRKDLFPRRTMRALSREKAARVASGGPKLRTPADVRGRSSRLPELKNGDPMHAVPVATGSPESADYNEATRAPVTERRDRGSYLAFAGHSNDRACAPIHRNDCARHVARLR